MHSDHLRSFTFAHFYKSLFFEVLKNALKSHWCIFRFLLWKHKLVCLEQSPKRPRRLVNENTQSYKHPWAFIESQSKNEGWKSQILSVLGSQTLINQWVNQDFFLIFNDKNALKMLIFWQVSFIYFYTNFATKRVLLVVNAPKSSEVARFASENHKNQSALRIHSNFKIFEPEQNCKISKINLI